MQIILIIAVVWYFFFRKSSTGTATPLYGNMYNTLDNGQLEKRASEILALTKDTVPDIEAIRKIFDGLNTFDFSMISYYASQKQKGFILEEWIRINIPESLDYFKYQFPDSF